MKQFKTRQKCQELEEPILNSLLGSWKGFSVISPPNLNGFGCNLEYKCGTTECTGIKKFMEIAPGVLPNSNKTCLFFLSPIQCSLLDTYLASILTTLEKTGVNWCARAHTREKFMNFCIGFCKPQKLPPEVVVWVGCLLPAYSWKVCNKSTQPRTLCVMGNKNWPKCYRGVKAGVAHSTWFLYDPPLTRVIHEYLEMSRSC